MKKNYKAYKSIGGFIAYIIVVGTIITTIIYFRDGYEQKIPKVSEVEYVTFDYTNTLTPEKYI